MRLTPEQEARWRELVEWRHAATPSILIDTAVDWFEISRTRPRVSGDLRPGEGYLAMAAADALAARLEDRPMTPEGIAYFIAGYDLARSWLDPERDDARAAYTIGNENSYDRGLAEDPDEMRKVGRTATYEGGWVWRTEGDARNFLSRTWLPWPAAVYQLELPTGWAADVSPEPAHDGVHRLLHDSRIVGKVLASTDIAPAPVRAVLVVTPVPPGTFPTRPGGYLVVDHSGPTRRWAVVSVREVGGELVFDDSRGEPSVAAAPVTWVARLGDVLDWATPPVV